MASTGRDGPKGRGSSSDPTNRFEKIAHETDGEFLDALAADGEDVPVRRTELLLDESRSIITRNDSPDVGFDASLNPYRGCEHGCAYCYARPTHEYLGMSAGLDFESKIVVKKNAPELLRAQLSSSRWKPRTLAMSGVTDCYQPVERKLELTRRCLGVLAEFRNPVFVITKNHLVTRDIDHLAELARHNAVGVAISITSLDAKLAGKMEPRASRPEMRLDAIRKLREAGIPAGVMVAPIVPGLTDHEIPSIVAAAAQAGACFAGYTIVRLPYGVKDLFAEWLRTHYPDRADKVLHTIESLRGGKLNDSRFGVRMRGEGALADTIRSLFSIARRKAGLDGPGPKLSTEAFRRPSPCGQLGLFDLD
jgi:DNA repair photolyase